MKTPISKKIGVFLLLTIFTLISIHFTIHLTKLLPADIVRQLQNQAYGAGSYYHDTYKVHVEYNPKKSIVRCRKDKNFPYIHFVTIFITKDGKLYDGEAPVYVAITPEDKYLDRHAKHHLVNLTEKGLVLSSLNRDLTASTGKLTGKPLVNDSTKNAKSFWGVIGDVSNLEMALAKSDTSNGLDAPNNELAYKMIQIKSGQNPVVIAIRTWNDYKSYDSKYFKLWSYESETYRLLLKGKRLSVPLNLDNVMLVREVMQRYEDNGGKIADLVPSAGKHYTGDPGDFVPKGAISPLTGRGRKYELHIMDIMKDLAEGRIIDPDTHKPLTELPAGNGPDWLEVAAGMAYNGPPEEVTKCVWKISIHDLLSPVKCTDGKIIYWKSVGGRVYKNIPYEVHLNPYKRSHRFNTSLLSAYGCVSNARGSAIHHESLHCHEHLPGPDLNDEEDDKKKLNDLLFVNKDGKKHKYYTFAFDNRERGFLAPNNWKGAVAERYLKGYDGDKAVYPYFSVSENGIFPIGVFITKIELTPSEQCKIFIDRDGTVKKPTDIPDDIMSIYDSSYLGSTFQSGWKGLIECTVLKILLYRRETRLFADEYLVKYKGEVANNHEFIEIVEEPAVPTSIEPGSRKIFPNGYYVPMKYSFKIHPYKDHPKNFPTADKFHFYISGANPYQKEPHCLYVLYRVDYKHMVTEYDAEIHGMTYGGE